MAMGADNPISILDFTHVGRYAVYEAEDEIEAAHAHQAIDEAGPRYKQSGVNWRNETCYVVAGVLNIDELFSLSNHTLRERVELHCPRCEEDYIGTLAIHDETGQQMSNCSRCGQSFRTDR